MKLILTMPTFSKTRIVYYLNRHNTVSSTNVSTLKSSTEFDNPANNNYKILIKPGSKQVTLTDEGIHHGWHSIPLNRYGLYVTMAEFQSLFEH